MDWIAGEQVSVGTLRVYGGDTYRCIQAHVTQSDWTPPAVPALWAIVVPSGPGEWAIGVAYSIGDEVTYGGTSYRCIQAHTAKLDGRRPRFRRCGRRYDDRPSGAGCNRHGCACGVACEQEQSVVVRL